MIALPENHSDRIKHAENRSRRFDLPLHNDRQRPDHLATAINEVSVEPAPATATTRQIIDSNQAVFGRELIFSADRQAATNTDDGLDGELSRPIASQLRALSLFAANPSQKSFVRTSRALLHSPAIEWLPVSAQVFALDFVGAPDEALLTRCRKLRDRGFSLALTAYAGIDARSRPLLSMLDIIEIRLDDYDESTCTELVGALRGLPIKLMASHVHTAGQMSAGRRAGFHLFQGDHIAPNAPLEADWLPVSRAGLVRLLALAMQRSGGEHYWASFEEACQREPSLLFNLLRLARRLARTGSLTAQQATPSLRQALEELDEYTLKRWIEVQLAALDSDPADYTRSYRTTRLAALGGRLLEQLMRMLEPTSTNLPAEAYLAGSLSILHRASGKPKSGFLRNLPISAEVSQALHQREGVLGHCLDVLDHFDRRDALACDHLLRRISRDRLSYADLQACFAEALAWLTATDD